jgi:hypothetical protein
LIDVVHPLQHVHPGIPALVIIDGVDGSVIDADGRSSVSAARGKMSKLAEGKWAVPAAVN